MQITVVQLLVIKITCMNLYLFWFKTAQNFELYSLLYIRLLYIRLALEVTMKRVKKLRVLYQILFSLRLTFGQN